MSGGGWWVGKVFRHVGGAGGEVRMVWDGVYGAGLGIVTGRGARGT